MSQRTDVRNFSNYRSCIYSTEGLYQRRLLLQRSQFLTVGSLRYPSAAPAVRSIFGGESEVHLGPATCSPAAGRSPLVGARSDLSGLPTLGERLAGAGRLGERGGGRERHPRPSPRFEYAPPPADASICSALRRALFDTRTRKLMRHRYRPIRAGRALLTLWVARVEPATGGESDFVDVANTLQTHRCPIARRVGLFQDR